MKKQNLKLIEYNAQVSRWGVFIALAIASIVIANLQTLKSPGTLSAKIYLILYFAFLLCSMFCGLINVLVTAFDYELSDKKFNTYAASKDQKILYYQYGALILSVIVIFLVFIDTI